MGFIAEDLGNALSDPSESVRLRAAMQAGMSPAPEYVGLLVERCAVEPDFYVRDMLTWALIQHDHQRVIAMVLRTSFASFSSPGASPPHAVQGGGCRSVARDWPGAPRRSCRRGRPHCLAYRRGPRPAKSRPWLAERLATQWGRGGRDVQLSLSRALCALGEDALPVIDRAIASDSEGVRLHALATRQLLANPDMSFDTALEHAKRVHASRRSAHRRVTFRSVAAGGARSIRRLYGRCHLNW